jgi:hypothetical protein
MRVLALASSGASNSLLPMTPPPLRVPRPFIVTMAPLVAIALLFVFALSAMAQSGAHGGHAEHHDEYKTWRNVETGVSCCSARDCRSTTARPGVDGWEAWDGHGWLAIPEGALLPFHARDGRSHLCEINGQVFCFTPAETRG